MLGGITLLAAATLQDVHAVMVSGATVALAVFAYLLIPLTNKSRDAGNEKAFKRLHFGSVLLTLTILGVNLSGLVL